MIGKWESFADLAGDLLTRHAPGVLLAASTATVTVAYYQVHGPTLHLLILLSLVWAFWYRRRHPRPIARTTLLLSGLFLLYALIAVLSAASVGFNPAALDRLENFSYFLAGALLLPFLADSRIRPDWFWIAIAATALLSGAYALWEMQVCALDPAYQPPPGLDYRAGGSKHKPIPFGDMAALAATLSLLGACVVWGASRPRAWLFAVAALAGSYATLVSGTRGAWVFYPTAAVVIGLYLAQRYPAQRRRILLAFLGLILAGGILVGQSPSVQERIQTAVSELRDYQPGTGVSSGNSLGERFEMWRAAWMAFEGHPWLGIGVGQLNAYFKDSAGRGLVSHAIVEFDRGNGHTHAHSDYVDTLATRGILGLGSLLLLYLVPLTIFAHAAFSRRHPARRDLGYAGMLVLLGYMQFSLTDSILLMRITAGFFVLLVCWLLALTVRPAADAPDQFADTAHS